jgi:hypothetical protein
MVISQLLSYSHVVDVRWWTPRSRRPDNFDRKAYAHCPLVHKVPLVIEWLGPSDKFDIVHFCNVIIAKLIQTLYPGGAIPRRRKFALHLFIARPPNSAGATELIDGKKSFDYWIRHILRMHRHSTSIFLECWKQSSKMIRGEQLISSNRKCI